jgi:hypothetical protein
VSEFSLAPCPLGLPVSETSKRHNASTGSSLSLSGLRVSRFRESGLPSSRLLASRVPGTRNAEMMTHDNMPPNFHDSGNREVSVLPSVLCLSKSWFTKCRTGLAFALSGFMIRGIVMQGSFLSPFEPLVAEMPKWKNAEIMPVLSGFHVSRNQDAHGMSLLLRTSGSKRDFILRDFSRNLDTKGIPAPWSLWSPKSRNAQMPKRRNVWRSINGSQ